MLYSYIRSPTWIKLTQAQGCGSSCETSFWKAAGLKIYIEYNLQISYNVHKFQRSASKKQSQIDAPGSRFTVCYSGFIGRTAEICNSEL